MVSLLIASPAPPAVPGLAPAAPPSPPGAAEGLSGLAPVGAAGAAPPSPPGAAGLAPAGAAGAAPPNTKGSSGRSDTVASGTSLGTGAPHHFYVVVHGIPSSWEDAYIMHVFRPTGYIRPRFGCCLMWFDTKGATDGAMLLDGARTGASGRHPRISIIPSTYEKESAIFDIQVCVSAFIRSLRNLVTKNLFNIANWPICSYFGAFANHSLQKKCHF